MRLQLFFTAALVVACAEQQAPLPAGYTVPPPANPPAARPTPAASGTPAQQEAQRIQRALNQDSRDQRMNAADGLTPRRTGEPDYAPYDEGAMGQMPDMPNQVSPAFRSGF
ncbi:hypothetical protein [Neoroseomonas oryzicola]|uniref:Lipoprotein n=1 Tax=Neoroseomonas oryzicola TaxID=535904 RepID=A0A9X9WD27_9PROT|nr:hypothetical protein [Neoroseomonas oryzicola]MBR0658237.1 hypothetical protein [Neoroseomonas oryzicola]NKE15946.1 hypothetical protein [Neoroseomonas oryzicola]